jgi:hypothetical protein
MLCCTRLAVAPRTRSATARWPCVLMATRSHPGPFTYFTISVTGSPNANSVFAVIPAVSNSLRTLSRYALSFSISSPPVPAACHLHSRRDVHEHQRAVHLRREQLDMVDDGAIGRRGFQGDEDGFVHCSLRKRNAEQARRLHGFNHVPVMTCHADLRESGKP